jgi:hypothetical protein
MANQPLRPPANEARQFGSDEYSNFQFGPTFNRSYEEQVGKPIDGSNKLARQLSPFTFSLLPPLMLGNVPEKNALLSLRQRIDVLALEARNLFQMFLDKMQVPTVPEVIPDPPPIPAKKTKKTRGGGVYNSGGEAIAGTDFFYEDWLQLSKYPWNDIAPEKKETYRANIQKCAENLQKAKAEFSRLAGGAVSIALRPGGGYRTPELNVKCSGDANSLHLQGMAADFQVLLGSSQPFTHAQVAAIMDGLMGSVISQGGLGIYDNFVHYDVRGGHSRWDKRTPNPEGGEGKAVGDASKLLPPPALESEAARLAGEAGYLSPLQRRTVPAAPPPDFPLIDAAFSANTWQEALDAKTRAGLVVQGSSIVGRASNRIQAEQFISQGLLQTNEHGAFEKPGIADAMVAVDIASQLDTILKTPPLTLLINPASFSVQYTKVHQFSQRTRYGYEYQAYGEDQPTLTISGSIGAFIAGGVSGELEPFTTTPTGVQFASKRNSAAYQNLMALLGFYKNAGYICDTVYRTHAYHMIGAIAIDYDQWVYVGHMNSFSWGYDQAETQNGKISFDLEFKVSQMFDNHFATESIQPLRSPTESPSSISNLGGVYPVVDAVPEGASSLYSSEEAPVTTGTGFDSWGITDADNAGGTPEIPLGEEGFVFTDAEAEAAALPYVVVDEAGNATYYATVEEAAEAQAAMVEAAEVAAEAERHKARPKKKQPVLLADIEW